MVAFICLLSLLLLAVACNCYCMYAYIWKRKHACHNSKCRGRNQNVESDFDNVKEQVIIDMQIAKIKDNNTNILESSQDASDEKSSSTPCLERVNTNQLHQIKSQKTDEIPLVNNKVVIPDKDEIKIEMEIVTISAKTSMNTKVFQETTHENSFSTKNHELQDSIDSENNGENEITIEAEIVTIPAKTNHIIENTKPNIEKTVKCTKCAKMFRDDQAMKTHSSRVHKDALLTSTRKCNDIPDFSDSIHAIDIIEKKNPACFLVSDISEEETHSLSRTKSKRKSVKKKTHLQLTFECSKCDSKFASQNSLVQHINSKH